MLRSALVLLLFGLVRVTSAAESAGATAANKNFIVRAPSNTLAREVLTSAEDLRLKLAKEWLRSPLPKGKGLALICVSISADRDEGLAWVADSPDSLSHIVWLTTSHERAVGSTLAHELTHVVLATEFPGQLPPWASEGAAGMYDDARRQRIRAEILQGFVKTGNWPSLEPILSESHISASEQKKYAVACGFMEYLLDQGSRQDAIAFALAGRATSWDQALAEHYDFRSIKELEDAWHTWMDSRLKNGGLAAKPLTRLR